MAWYSVKHREDFTLLSKVVCSAEVCLNKVIENNVHLSDAIFIFRMVSNDMISTFWSREIWLTNNDFREWNKFIWLRILASIGFLLARQWAFGFHKRRRISWLAERVSASQEGLFSVELLNSRLKMLSEVLKFDVTDTLPYYIIGNSLPYPSTVTFGMHLFFKFKI